MMRGIQQLLSGGATALILALALATGSSPNVAWNSGPIAGGNQPEVSYSSVEDARLDRAFGSPDVSYGPVAVSFPNRVFGSPGVSYGPVAVSFPDRVFDPAVNA